MGLNATSTDRLVVDQASGIHERRADHYTASGERRHAGRRNGDGSSSTLTVTVPATVQPGTYPLTITGSVGAESEATTVFLIVQNGIDLTQMGLWSAFVDRHETLVGPNGPSDASANGGLYGLSGSDVGIANALVDSTSQQLIQLQAQAQAQSLDGPTYLSRRNAILMGLNTALHSQLQPQSAAQIDRYADFVKKNSVIKPMIGVGNTQTSPLAVCDPTTSDCAFMHSEINFYNGGGSNYGLGTQTNSFVEDADSNKYVASVTRVKESYSSLLNAPRVDSSWQTIVEDKQDYENGDKGALYPNTITNPKRGSYKIESFHNFSLNYNGTVASYPPYTDPYIPPPPPPPSYDYFEPNSPGVYDGYEAYWTTVDLQLQVSAAAMTQSGDQVTVTSCSSPIAIHVDLTPALPSGNQAPPIAWTGGTPVGNSHSLDRTAACAPGTTTVTAAFGTNLSATVTITVQPVITGRVTSSDGTGIGGITISQQLNVITDANGYYSVAVAAGSSYLVQPNDQVGTYGFDPQSIPFINITANQTANFTANPRTVVYLIHGIDQTSTSMDLLAATLNLSVGIDVNRYRVDSGFTFGCATASGGACTVQPGQTLVNLGGQWLGYYIQQNQPLGNVILVGYSLGGLVARDLIANNYYGVLDAHPVTALITLGTPNLGYPGSDIDKFFQSSEQLVLDMSGSWINASGYQLTSPYLNQLQKQWESRDYPGYWMAAAGEQSSNPIRNFPVGSIVGCPSWMVRSDGVVCRDSALYGADDVNALFNYGPIPDVPWSDSTHIYVHTASWAGWGAAAILGGNSGDPNQNPQLFNPPSNRTLFPQIKAVINAH